MAKTPTDALESLAENNGFSSVNSKEFAQYLDENDALKDFRQKFFLEEGNLYFCGNSLGMPPKKAKEYLTEVFDNWAKLGVHTHFTGKFGAAFCDKPGLPYTEELVGAITDEVALLNGLTVNLHFLLQAFYKPTSKRWKILIEDHAFPSDRYAVWSQVEHHGYDKDSVIIVKPRPDEETFRTEDILEVLKENGDEIAVVLLPGIQYYTGQLFDMPKITSEAQKLGCIVGWDLAHAVGNVKLALHDWNVDFAAWCSYKYMNSSPGGISGIFVHSRYFENPPGNLTGWWSNKCETRFQMNFHLDRGVGAAAFRVSNPPPLLLAPNYASLEIFHEAGMERITQKQFLLTGFLEYLIRKEFAKIIKIITPGSVSDRGSQLSLVFDRDLKIVHEKLEANNVSCDTRSNVMRIAPAPLYNSFMDVWNFIQILHKVLSNDK